MGLLAFGVDPAFSVFVLAMWSLLSCRRLLTGCVLASREAWAVNCAFQVVLAHLLGLWVQDILVFCLQDWVVAFRR